MAYTQTPVLLSTNSLQVRFGAKRAFRKEKEQEQIQTKMTVEAVKSRKLELDSVYFNDYRETIRSRTIPWDGFRRGGLLNKEEADVFTHLERLSVSNQKERSTILSGEHLHTYTKTIWDVLKKDLPEDRNDVKKFVLVIISDLLNDEGFLKELANYGNGDNLISPFVPYLGNSDETIKLLSLYNLSYLLIQPFLKFSNSKIVNSTFQSLQGLIESTNFNLKFFSVQLISELLTVKENSSIFISSHQDIIVDLFQSLETISSSNTTEAIQFQYKILLSIWILTFSKSFNSAFITTYSSETLDLLKLVKISIKEKIIRLILSIFLNLVSNVSSDKIAIENIKFLILTGNVLPILKNLQNRKWTDDELVLDLEALLGRIEEIYAKLTSFDEYLQELKSGEFKNSPTHTNDEFFIDNLHYFQDSNYRIFKKLIGLLDKEHNDTKNLVFILNDISKILKLDPKAIEILNREEKKTKIMELLNYKNSEVRYEALKTTQLIVSQSFK